MAMQDQRPIRSPRRIGYRRRRDQHLGRRQRPGSPAAPGQGDQDKRRQAGQSPAPARGRRQGGGLERCQDRQWTSVSSSADLSPNCILACQPGTFPGFRGSPAQAAAPASVDPPSVESQPPPSEAPPPPPPLGPKSVHGKLLRLVLTTLLLVTSSTLVIVAGYSMRLSRRTLAELEAQIRSSIEAQGHSLVIDQAVALRSLVTDNAFGDVAALVKATRDRESDVVYGLFLAADGRPWAWVSPDAAGRSGLAPGKQLAQAGREHQLDRPAPRPAFAPSRTGTSRCSSSPRRSWATRGCSAPSSTACRAPACGEPWPRARADARYAALRTVALLGLLGVGGLALGFLLARGRPPASPPPSPC